MTITRSVIQESPVSAQWLRGTSRFRFSSVVRFGRQDDGGPVRIGSQTRTLVVDVTATKIRALADLMVADPTRPHHGEEILIRRGAGWQRIPIEIPREMIIGIARAIDGSRDDEDAGHRFWHWANPGEDWPCAVCRDPRDARPGGDLAARSQIAVRWSVLIGAPAARLEQMLAEYDQARSATRYHPADQQPGKIVGVGDEQDRR